MLNAMRDMALLELNRRFRTVESAMGELRRDHGEQIAPLLVEAAEKIEQVYLLQADPRQPHLARMWAEDLTMEKARRLPFNRPSGSQSGAIGPVFKRSFKRGGDPPYGPSPKIQNTTRTGFSALAEGNAPWAPYFREVSELLFGTRALEYAGRSCETGPDQPFTNPLHAALSLIPATTTVFLAVVDGQGRWPGERQEYQAYLAHALAQIKYLTGAAPALEHGECPLCGVTDTLVYPNALKGAGINFANMDREGAFPGLNTAQAWKGYALCLDCADLLYVFKFHLLDDFLAPVAGEKALVLPSLLGNPTGRRQFMRDWGEYIRGLEGRHVADLESDLMEFFAGQEDAHLLLNILWASFGQLIEDCRGYLTDVLPSRLQRLARLNGRANAWSHALTPSQRISEADFDLALSCLRPLFRRPGGKAADKVNSSPQMFALKRQLAEAVYRGHTLGDPASLWGELLTTAGWYLKDVGRSGADWGLTHEGLTKNNVPYWTLAGWLRHLARFLHYLDQTGVLPMPTDTDLYQPRMERLKPFFAAGSGIDRREKAFAFVLGVLYGKLLQVQAARGVNVASNALTWLKRLNLTGRDLPGLYNRVREKLLSYNTESSAAVRELVQELGRLGALLGDRIDLDNTATCYFLLLGQSVAVDVLPASKEQLGEDQ